MMTAIVSLQQFDDEFGRHGDVLLLKRDGAAIGVLDYRDHLVCEWEDAEIEALMDDSLEDKNLSMSIPYAEYSQAGELTIQSRRAVDVESLPAELYARLMDPDDFVERVPWATIAPYVFERTA